jgi:hypothetical protein
MIDASLDRFKVLAEKFLETQWSLFFAISRGDLFRHFEENYIFITDSVHDVLGGSHV